MMIEMARVVVEAAGVVVLGVLVAELIHWVMCIGGRKKR